MAKPAMTARAKVDGIRKRLGFPSKEYLDKFNQDGLQELLQEMLEMLQSKDRIIGGSIITLAKSLYTSKARFVFELLQNAEDNHYTKAVGRGEKPRVTFHLYHDRIIQECNEDGFNDANLEAICSIGESSKSGSQGYIGEKGIGFKSVFMVASKVYIESREFSFYFEHHPGDIGMGMIAPQWQEPEEDVGEKITRITLSLHRKNLTTDEITKQGQMIRKQFEEIHEAIMLFMTKLKNIEIIFYTTDEAIEKTIQFSVENTWPRTTVKRFINENDETRDDVKHYFTHTHLVAGLARNENRQYSANDQSYSSSNITLAFPLTEQNEPLLDTQWVFAYLPTCRMGFKFLIQADFVTQANREGIVSSSARNQSLMPRIAQAFIQSILAMQKVPSLRYTWMRYLPTESDFPWDEMWLELLTSIKTLIQETKVLECAHNKSMLKLINDSRRHALTELSSDGKPLFRDTEPNFYISLQYQNDDLDLLEDFGLSATYMDEILQRAQKDLEHSESKIKLSLDSDTQSRIARLLMISFERGWEERISEVRELKMLQTRTQKWHKCLGNSVFFPHIQESDLDIPNGIPWMILRKSSRLTPDTMRLYELMGVKNATIKDVRTAIKGNYNRNNIDWNYAAIHLRFLYLTDDDSTIDYARLGIRNSNNFPCYTSHKNIYIRDDEIYGVAELLEPTPTGSLAGNGAPGRQVQFMHASYFENVPKQPKEQKLSWKEWLHIKCGVNRHLPLLDANKTSLSDDCKYLAKHRPDRFLGFLQSVWPGEEQSCQSKSDIVNEILDVEVAALRNTRQNNIPMKEAYLPLTKYTELCDRFLLEDEFFPFVELREPLSHGDSPPEWAKLGDSFGLGYHQQDMVGFLLDVISAIEDGKIERGSEPNPERIYDIYLYLHATSRQAKDYSASCEMIRNNRMGWKIFIPGDNVWDETSLCVWEAPNGIRLEKKYSLAQGFLSLFPESKSNQILLEDFFINTLNVSPKCTWEDLVEEIRWITSEGSEDNFETVHALYECLSHMSLNSDDKKQLRSIFAEEALIYDNTNGGERWHKRASCIWSSAISIRDMFAINALYDDLRSFFVGTLQVQRLTVEMAYKQLIGDVSEQSVEEMKTTLGVFCALLESEGGNFDPQPILDNEIFPILFPEGNVELCSIAQDFAMRDRRQLSDDFADKACFLDFDMESIRRLQPFIDWVGLEGRYISRSIREISSVDPGSTHQISRADRQIMLKSHALTRIAVTFGSPRIINGDIPHLYDMFKASSTLETNKITTKLILSQNGEPLSVDKESAMLYIPHHASELKVYLTNNQVEQESCFCSKLPGRLAQWIMSEPDRESHDPAPSQMLVAVQSVLSVSRAALPNVLDELGIVSIELEDDIEEIILPSRPQHPPTATSDSISYTPHSPNSNYSATLLDADEAFSIPAVSGEIINDNIVQSASSQARAASRSYEPVFVESRPSNSGYNRLLSHVVTAARRTRFPRRGENMNLQGPIGTRNSFNLGQYDKLERDKRVGAAGELFVYELLSRLSPELPGFSIADWQSNIRHYASGHPDYTEIQNWNGTETSDIVYKDVNGVLTNFLVETGYLNGEEWENAVIEYYIEVKTTTDRCSAPFYMSNAQHIRMARYSIRESSFWTARRLYMIFRVFDLTKESVKLQVLVDPEAMRQDGLLSFTADTWTVRINES